jgi:hypothetical protein
MTWPAQPNSFACDGDKYHALNMRAAWCLAVICIAAVSCQREASRPRTLESAASPKTNVVSRLDEKGRATETMVYATNGSLKQRTVYVTAADGRILTARTVDAQGRPKWTEQYSYGKADDHRLIEIRRLRTDGQIISVRFVSSPDGTERKIVTGPDGKEIPESEQARFLGE